MPVIAEVSPPALNIIHKPSCLLKSLGAGLISITMLKVSIGLDYLTPIISNHLIMYHLSEKVNRLPESASLP